MAKKKGRKFRRYIRGNVDEQHTIGALASATVSKQNFDESVSERTWASSIVATYSMSEFTPAAGDGPILVGVAHSDYTASEIEGFIESGSSWDEGNLVQREVGQRKIRILGTFPAPSNATEQVALNEGKPLRTKLGWVLTTGATLSVWTYNLGLSAPGTTVPLMFCQGHVNLWPM